MKILMIILGDLKSFNDKNEMVDFSNQVDVPLDSTNQLGDFEDWINRPNESILQNIPVQSQIAIMWIS